jgi:hypothetical protein
MDKVQKPSSPECHIPSSESFKVYLCNRYGPGIHPSIRKLEHLKIQLAKTLNHITFLMRCKSQSIIPKGLLVKTPYSSRRSYKIAHRASMAILRDRIHFHWNNKASILQKIHQLENFLRSSVSNLDQQRIFTAVESSFRNNFNKQKGFIYASSPFLRINMTRSGPRQLLHLRNLSLISQNMSLQTVRNQSLRRV